MSKPTLQQCQQVRDEADCLCDTATVEKAITELAEKVARDYAGLNPVVVCAMNGALWLTGRLVEQLDMPLELDYLHASRYRGETTGGELMWQAEPQTSLGDRHVLIVDDILDYSKLQKNAITLERIDYNLETAMLDILEMQAPMAHSKGLELSLVSSNGRSYEIKGDPTRFKQVFSNLVSNAIKFTDKGSVAISLDIQHISSHQSLIIISVTDTGIGISEQQLNKLFKAFVQADTSITRRFGGSGLGLVIAKALTKLMGRETRDILKARSWY